MNQEPENNNSQNNHPINPEPVNSNNENTEEKQSPNPVVNQGQVPNSKDVEDNKLFAILAYLGILFLIPLLAKKESPFAQFHAKQGMVLFIAGLIAGFVMWIPLIGWFVGIAFLVFMIMGIVNASSGKLKKLPWIGDFADKINL